MNVKEAIRIHSENVDEFTRRRALADAQRRNSLSELIRLFVNSSDRGEASEVYESYRQTMPSSSYEDRAELCMALAVSKVYGAEMWSRCFAGDDIAAGSHGKISLVRNKYNEIAFSRFSRILKRPKEIFVSSFTAACEDVYDSESEFCILPIENGQNGRLFGFYSMLDRYELKICAVCELDGEDEVGAKYALVGRSAPDRIPKNANWGYEFSVISGSGRALSEISGVSRIFGAELLKIDSLPVEYDSGLQKYYFTFDIPEANISAFDLFLSEEYSGYTSVGVYPTVDQDK